MPSGDIKSGYALIAGPANTGKSSLLNSLVDFSLSPAVPQPASTRMPITGICTPGNAQICFVDTPPIESGFDKSILKWVDVVVLLLDIRTFEHDVERPELENFLNLTQDRPRILALGKCDHVKASHREAYLNKARYTNRFTAYTAVNPIGSIGVDKLLDMVLENIPRRRRLFPRSINTLNSKRFLISEQVRTQLFTILPLEAAAETAVQAEEISMRDGKLYVRVNLIVSKASSKGLLIGRKGHTLERINQMSSSAIKEFTGDPCRLDLWVKVREAWPDSKKDMLEFGYVC